MKILKKMMNFFLNKEFVLFIVIGGINTLSGVFFSYIYSLLLGVNLAFVVGYMTGLLVSYILNSKITFREKLSVNRFMKFAISYIPNFIIQNTVVFIVYNKLGCDKLLAYCLAAILGIPITFFILKIFTFKKDE